MHTEERGNHSGESKGGELAKKNSGEGVYESEQTSFCGPILAKLDHWQLSQGGARFLCGLKRVGSNRCSKLCGVGSDWGCDMGL